VLVEVLATAALRCQLDDDREGLSNKQRRTERVLFSAHATRTSIDARVLGALLVTARVLARPAYRGRTSHAQWRGPNRLR
jgi:hypothetical protein